jgi:hypothetical protein
MLPNAKIFIPNHREKILYSPMVPAGPSLAAPISPIADQTATHEREMSAKIPRNQRETSAKLARKQRHKIILLNKINMICIAKKTPEDFALPMLNSLMVPCLHLLPGGPGRRGYSCGKR